MRPLGRRLRFGSNNKQQKVVAEAVKEVGRGVDKERSARERAAERQRVKMQTKTRKKRTQNEQQQQRQQQRQLDAAIVL